MYWSVWINMSLLVSNDWNLFARIPDSIGKDIEKACQGVYPLHDVYVRKVKVLKKPKFDGTCSLCADWGHWLQHVAQLLQFSNTSHFWYCCLWQCAAAAWKVLHTSCSMDEASPPVLKWVILHCCNLEKCIVVCGCNLFLMVVFFLFFTFMGTDKWKTGGNKTLLYII